LPKVISEMVGGALLGAAANRQVCPTISEMTFGNHSNSCSVLNSGIRESDFLKKSARNVILSLVWSFRSFGANTSAAKCAYGGGYV